MAIRTLSFRRARHAALSSLLTLCLLCLLAACGDAVGSTEDFHSERWSPNAVGAGNLRVGTFNIRNYPELPYTPTIDPVTGEASKPPAPPSAYVKQTNESSLLDVLDRLDFDLLAVQEIVDVEAFEQLVDALGRHEGRSLALAMSANENGSSQHVGFIFDTDKFELLWSREHPQIDTSGRLRPGLSARFASRSELGLNFGAMVLHLASGSSAKRAALRAEQITIAAGIVAEEIAETGDDDYMLLGDLNTARHEQEWATMDAVLEQSAGLLRQQNALSCTTYWIKSKNNPMLRPSALDLVYLSGFGERDESVPLTSGGHCAEHLCEPFESVDKLSGSSFFDVSDHCPVYFEVRTQSDDPSPQ